MPIYEFKCKCKEIKKIVLPYRLRNMLMLCEKCDGELKRIEISQSTFILKGDGWFNNKKNNE